MEIQRRAFLGTIGTGALAASVTTPSTGAVAAGAWDLSWTERLNARHRAVFDSPEFSDGAALQRAVVWRRQYREVYGAAPEDVKGVLVLRADAIWLVMNDVFWKDYGVGEKARLKDDDTGKYHVANPVASSPATPKSADMNIPAFLAAGNVVLACHLAFRSVVSLVKSTDKLDTDDEAENKALGFVLPGVIMQPSGVFATLRAQEAGCSYILAS